MRKITLFLFVVFAIVACDVGVNRTIEVADGETVDKSLNSVNGGIRIGDGATVTGSSRSVNGDVRVGRDARVGALQSVNGGIDVGTETQVGGDIETVNGGIRCERGVEVDGKTQSVNGAIKLYGAVIDGNVETHNGDITLLEEARVRGSIIIETSGGSSDDHGKLTIRISDDSVVEGDIIVEDRRRRVEVVLSDGGKVMGEIKNAEVVERKN